MMKMVEFEYKPIVLAYAYKSFSKIDKVFGYVLVFCFLLAGIIFSAIYRILEVYIVSIVIILLGLILFILLLIESKNIKKIKDEIILYDETDKTLIINKYGKDFKIAIKDIEKIEYRNKEFAIDNPIIYRVKTEHGKLIFILNNSKKIVTLKIKDVVNVYDKITDIFNGISIEY